MAEITIKDAISTDAQMIVSGDGRLAASAMCAAGHQNILTTTIDPTSGRPAPAQTAEDLTRTPDPALKMEPDPRLKVAVGAPEFNGGPKF